MLKLCQVVHEPNLKGCVVCCPVGTFAVARCTPSVYVTDGFSGCPQWERMFEATSWSDLPRGTKIVIVKMSHWKWWMIQWRTMNDEEWCVIVWCIICMLHVHVDIKSTGHRHIVFPPCLSYSGGTWPVGVYLRPAWEGLSNLGRFSWNVSNQGKGFKGWKGYSIGMYRMIEERWIILIWSWDMIGVILELWQPLFLASYVMCSIALMMRVP